MLSKSEPIIVRARQCDTHAKRAVSAIHDPKHTLVQCVCARELIHAARRVARNPEERLTCDNAAETLANGFCAVAADIAMRVLGARDAVRLHAEAVVEAMFRRPGEDDGAWFRRGNAARIMLRFHAERTRRRILTPPQESC